MRQPDFIACADLHLRGDTPSCRTDAFQKAQWNKVRFLGKLLEDYSDARLLCAGDVFHKWRSDPWVITKAIELVPDMILVPGQHDMPNHSQSLFRRSALTTLLTARPGIHALTSSKQGRMYHTLAYKHCQVFGRGFSDPVVPKDELDHGFTRVLLWHRFIWQGARPFPTADENGHISRVLKECKDFDIIITGDNHQPFTYKKNGQLLVNCGSMMRQTSDQADYRPAVWFIWLDGLHVERVDYPIQKGVVTRPQVKEGTPKHLDSAFADRLADGVTHTLDFRQNLKRHLVKHPVSGPVERVLWELVEEK